MKQLLSVMAALALVTTGAAAADLSVEAQFNITGKDAVKNYLTVKGPTASVTKDSVDPKKVDVVGGASLNKGTEVWNTYRAGADKLPAISLGFQSLVKYGVSNLAQFKADGLSVVKGADGVITIQYVHRGTAYKIVTDNQGRLDLEKGFQLKRTIGYIEGENQVLSPDFAPSGTIKDVNYAKIWDTKIPGGKAIGKAKTGDIMADVAASKTAFTGIVQLTLVGEILTVKADLTQKK